MPAKPGSFQKHPAKSKRPVAPTVSIIAVPHIEEVMPLLHTYDQLKPEGSYFDEMAAQHAVDFIQRLKHFKGKMAGQPFTLLAWQLRVVRELFGWMREDGTRLYRECYIEAARKSGKTFMAAAIGLYLAYEDQEAGVEVSFAAFDKDQASQCYGTARNMVEADTLLDAQTICYNSKKEMLIPTNPGSLIKCLSKDSAKSYGLNLHGLIFDELMTQKTREMWDALTTSQGAREQPLIFSISTAGWDRESVCYEQHERVRNISEGSLNDPYFLGAIFSAADDVMWDTEPAWRAANPSLGVSVNLSYYEEKCRAAQNNPPAQNGFITLLCNKWVGSQSRFIPMADWDACDSLDADIAPGSVVFGGLDLSATTDLSAFVIAAPGKPIKLRAWLFIPGENMRDRALRDKAPYESWIRQGFLTPTPGNVIDYDFIHAVITQSADEFDLQEIAFDPYNATQFVLDLQKDGINVRPLRQGVQSISAPAKELLRQVMQRQLAHGRNPVLRWMADHCAVKADEKGNIQLDKTGSTSRIDGIVGAVMALDGVMRHDAEPKISVYDKRLAEERALLDTANRVK